MISPLKIFPFQYHFFTLGTVSKRHNCVDNEYMIYHLTYVFWIVFGFPSEGFFPEVKVSWTASEPSHCHSLKTNPSMGESGLSVSYRVDRGWKATARGHVRCQSSLWVDKNHKWNGNFLTTHMYLLQFPPYLFALYSYYQLLSLFSFFVWSQRLKSISGLLRYFILHLNDPILLHNRPKSRFNQHGTVCWKKKVGR